MSTNKSEDERIQELEEILPEIREEISELSSALSDYLISDSDTAFEQGGFSPLQIPIIYSPVQSAALFAGLPNFFALTTVVGTTASGPCGTVVFDQKLGKGTYFVTLTNEGDCRATFQGASLPNVDKGNAGGGVFYFPASRNLKVKCTGRGGTCKVKINIIDISAIANTKGTWVDTSAEDAACNATVAKYRLPSGKYHITVKNNGTKCPVAIQGAPGIAGAIPKGGGVGGGAFSLSGSTDVSVKCSGTGGTGPCKIDVVIKRTG